MTNRERLNILIEESAKRKDLDLDWSIDEIIKERKKATEENYRLYDR
tara:strand:+ start:218 stop:358 length:141 start_codon:yes stop_codon:yes gene_type:complete